MSISRNHTTYCDFVENEISTLGFLQGSTQIEQNFPDLYQQACIFYPQYNKKQNKGDIKFTFKSDLALTIEKHQNKKRIERIVIIEALLQPGFQESVYAVSIINKKKGKYTILRKFHFDYTPIASTKDRKPIYHFQYGGKPTPRLNDLNVNCQSLMPWLSLPRLYSSPMNLALILDMVFCEFPGQETHKITDNNLWRDLIKSNEDMVSKEYFNRVNEFFQHDHTSKFLYRDFYYGKV